jgi:phosphoribosylformylglycinamidine synthase I
MRVAVLNFPGTWSERDFAHALRLAGAEPQIVWHEEADLAGYDAAVLPGGFSYGDYLRAGAIAKLSPAIVELRRFAAAGGAVLGSCNGFQVLCEAGMLPGALVRNEGLEFRCEWVHMRVESAQTPFTRGLQGRVLRMPIAHGEGRWVADAETLRSIEANGQVVFRYVDERGVVTAEANPNGALANVAGLRDRVGNVLGLMPHPERCAEALLGGTDGYLLLRRLVASGAGMRPAALL